MNKTKIIVFTGVAVLAVLVVALRYSLAQTTIKPLKLSSVTSVSSSNPAGNYSLSGGEIWNDNNGISVWTGNFPTPYTECGHLGMPWNLSKTTDPQQANIWENRNTCNGNIAIGIADKVEEQILTLTGITEDGKNVTLNINVPAMSGTSLGNWKLYVDDTGAAYYCKSDHTYPTNRYPNDCDLTVEQALTSAHLARTGNSPVCGNNLCQTGETYGTCPADCATPPPTCTLTPTKTSYTKPEYVNYTYTCSASASVAVQVVKPDGTATTYNSATNITTSTMGFDTSNLNAGNYTLRICVNDTTCSPASLVSVPFTLLAPAATGPALIGHWKFDGNGNNEVSGSPAATIVGGSSFKTTGGKLGGYGYVPTGSDAFKIPYDARFDLPDSFTIEFWFRQRANQSSNQNLVYKGSAPNNYNFNISRWLWNEYNYGPVIAGHTAANTGYWTQPSNPNQLAHNEWHNVVFTKSPTYHAYYLDGVLIGSKDVSSSSSYASDYGGPAKTPHNDIIIGDTAVDTDFDNLKIYNYALSAAEVSAIGGFPVPVPGASAPEPSNNESGVWAQVDIATGQILSTAICTRSVCGINGEYHGYVPPASFAIGSTWWPTSKRYIWQLSGQAGYSSGTFNFNTYVFTVAGGTIYNGVFTSTTTPGNVAGTTTSSSSGSSTSTTTTAPRACANSEKCSSGSWCQSGSQCYYPDSQLTCVAWPTGSSAGMSSVTCPGGTSPCNPTDANCVAPGQTVPYSSSTSKWCAQGQQYYSADGKNMTCVRMGESAPSGYSSCRPDDKSCIPENSYGPSTGWCSNGMKCYQKATDTNQNNDVYCVKMGMGMAAAETTACPSGYSLCAPTDTNCKQKGDSWTDANSSYNCMNSQKCTSSSGGGSCVGWNEACPAGTKYCNTSETSCVEPDSYKSISSSNGSYWCGGGGGMVFYSSAQAYCPPKKISTSSMGMMWTAAEIKAVLDKLGSDWKLCKPGETNCIEPGKTGPGTGWCAWTPPGNYTPSSGTTRTCPSLAESISTSPGTTTVPTITPEEPKMCLQALTKAGNAATGECKVFPNSCLPAGWVKSDCKVGEVIPPISGMRECAPNEVPNQNNNYCLMPMYRWNIQAKAFEKCDTAAKNAPYVDVKSDASAKYTRCESMNYEIEKEWKTKRYLVRPPEKYGDWYMPWDATAKQMQYRPDIDQFGECDMRAYATAPNPGVTASYMSPCMPVPDEDKEWLLLKARAEYKMYKLYQKGIPSTPTPSQPIEQLLPVLPPVAVPVISGKQCKPYLAGIRQSLNSDKIFWKDVKRNFDAAVAYPEAATIKQSLDESRDIIASFDKTVKSGKCDNDALTLLQTKLNTLHTELFPELSSHISALQDFARAGQCRNKLSSRVNQLKKLLKTANGADGKKTIEGLAGEIGNKFKEFDERAQDFDFDAGYECEAFAGEIEPRISAALRVSDMELDSIIESVVSRKLEPVLDKLTKQLEERGQKIDELLVKVAELHKAMDAVTQKATQISENITVSYAALSRIDDKFAEAKTQMQNAKDRLIPLVGEAAGLVKNTNCVRGADRDALTQKLGDIASVNWIGDRADQVERRLNLFITSCKSKDVSKDDIAAFTQAVDELGSQNAQVSYKEGLTFDASVPTHAWFYGAYQTAYKSGYVTQGRPAENTLAQDALLMILRASGEQNVIGNCTLGAPTVTSVSPYAVCAVNLAYDKGLSLQRNMTSPITRVLIAEWIAELSKLQPPAGNATMSGYADLRGLNQTERSAASAMISNEIMVGDSPDGTVKYFRPELPLSRASLVVILEKLKGLMESSSR